MNLPIRNRVVLSSVIVLMSLVVGMKVVAQTTAFTYQGKLTDAGNPANGNYDLQFALFDNVSGGTQFGSTLTRTGTSVSAGIFTVQLDFGVSAFPGANRFLEIRVGPAGGSAFTTLSPRQQISSTPYAIRTVSAAAADGLSSACAACVQNSQINSVAGSKVTGTIPVGGVPAGSGNYIQNTNSLQSNANFNISGNGTAGNLNINNAFTFAGASSPPIAPAGQARIYFDLASNKLRVSESGAAFVNLVGAGGVSGSGTTNSVPLWSAGTSLGSSAISQSGTRIGIGTGTPAHRLAVVGGPAWTGDAWGGALELDNASAIAWRQNTSGVKFGIGRTESGLYFFRTNSPLGTTTNGPIYDFKMDNAGNVGIGNVGIDTDLSGAKFSIRTSAGQFGLAHTDGTVTIASLVAQAPSFAAGGHLGTQTNHPLHFFTNGSLPQLTLSTSGSFGIGTQDPIHIMHAKGNFHTRLGLESTSGLGSASVVYKTDFKEWIAGVAGSADSILANRFFIAEVGQGARMVINQFGSVGVGTTDPARLLHVNGRARIGSIPLEASAAGVCFNAFGDLLQCGVSSLRLKTNIVRFTNGLDIVRKLKPISFDWKDGSGHDIGLGAEDVAQVAPSFTLSDRNGEIAGVKYERLNILLINAVQEQQQQIDQMRAENAQLKARFNAVKEQQRQIERLTARVRFLEKSRRKKPSIPRKIDFAQR